MPVRVLSFHAEYKCRHRGRCCTSGWPIPVEEPERTEIERAVAAGLLAAPPGFHSRDRADAQPTGPTLIGTTDGRCVFHDDHATGGCRIHRTLGHAALPLACRQFPRLSVRDPRGVSVTLSHYCPTAADLMAHWEGGVAIVHDAPAFPANAEYVGLVADAALPPLLHPRLAMDWDSWWLFERLSLELLADAPDPLDRLALAVEFSREWAVDRGRLQAHLITAFGRARHAEVRPSLLSVSRTDQRIADAFAAVPDAWQGAAREGLMPPAGPPVGDTVLRRYLAAHAFANWAAYQGEGVRTWFRAVETAACVLSRTSDPGRADLLLRHLVDTAALIRRWHRAEQEGPPRP